MGSWVRILSLVRFNPQPSQAPADQRAAAHRPGPKRLWDRVAD